MDEEVALSTFEEAVHTIEVVTPAPDPYAPSCLEYRLRPSEQAEILRNRRLNPPPPWGLKINLARSFIGPEKCVLLGKKILLNSTLTYLDLSANDMGEEAAEQFFRCVAGNSTLRHLGVNGNFIGDRGAIAAAPCLLKLESLHASSNGITDVGAFALAEALQNSTTMKTLAVRNNRITVRGVERLIAALEPPDTRVVQHPAERSAALGDTATMPLSNNAPDTPAEMRGSHVSTSRVPSTDATPTEPMFCSTLSTLWFDQNVAIPEELFERAALILATRFPKPAAPPQRSKKTAKKKK